MEGRVRLNLVGRTECKILGNNRLYVCFTNETRSIIGNSRRAHPTLQPFCQSAIARGISSADVRMDSRFAYSFLAMSGARVGDLVPGPRGACAHQPPVLLFSVDYPHNLSFDSTNPGLITCASLRCVSTTATYWMEGNVRLTASWKF